MLLEVTNDERELLAWLLQREIDELGPEIHHTRKREYREGLKAERHVLEALLERLQVPQAG